jgi:hypothetical protein
MARLYPLVLLLDIALLVVALIDCLSAAEPAIRALPRAAWVFVILLFSPIGALAWFVAGRPAQARAGRPARAVLAPDDDPEFLRSLAEDLRRRQTEPEA